ncbi:MAG: hypothetical protein NC078_04485 [Ruminococcus sp.]|nr:hypothetical protein [Ruminococcus sp.]
MNGNYNDKGAADIPRIVHLMKLGALFSVVGLISDIILGYGETGEEAYGLPSSFARYLEVSDVQIFWSAVIGLISIPMVCLCCFSVYRLIMAGSGKHAHMYRSGIIGSLIFGGTVHISCCSLAYFLKRTAEYDPENILNEAMTFAGYFLLPPTVLFMIFFAVLIIAHIKAIAKGETLLPGKAWVFCPLFGIIAAAVLKLPGLPFTNALATGWINIGFLWTYCGLLFMMKKHGGKTR